MKNEAKSFEMTEEQLDMVAGGTASNSITQTNGNSASTYNTALWASNVNQYGSVNTNAISNTGSQKAQDSWSTVTKTWATLFSYNYPY